MLGRGRRNGGSSATAPTTTECRGPGALLLLGAVGIELREGDSPHAYGFDGPFVRKPYVSSDEQPMTRNDLFRYLESHFPESVSA